jgi:oxygen-independent coproporphyrinogen III oxidase
MLFNTTLIQKYNKPGPRYTSYPPANFFQPDFKNDTMLEQLKQSNKADPRNLSFYFHVPFCPQLCHFCGCNTGPMREKAFVERYFDAMKTELEKVAPHIDRSREITQVHWGGGTPNAVSLHYIADVMKLLHTYFDFASNCEIAMECSPAYMTLSQIDQLSEIGFTRISLGIQDFKPLVLEIINRKASKLPIKEVVEHLKSKKIKVNLDFVYGLPGQTPESFELTIKQAINLSPERIVTFSYAHVPWVKEAQKKLEEYAIPGPDDKLEMYERAYHLLLSNGYVTVGLDHFAKPQDEMAQALSDGTLHRNFMGYCTKANTGQVYAFGSTAITQLDGAYIQNIKNTESYIKAVSENGLAAERGYVMTRRDKMCRTVIEELMCNQQCNLNLVAQQFNISIGELKSELGFEAEMLQPMLNDNLVTWQNNIITVLPQGHMFLRNIAMLFDPLQKQDTGKRYSKTV